MLSDEHKEMLLVMCIDYISSHVLCFFHHNQLRQHLLEDIATGKFQC